MRQPVFGRIVAEWLATELMLVKPWQLAIAPVVAEPSASLRDIEEV
jgi:hypothetical protein